MKYISLKYRLFLYFSIGIGFLIGFYIITIIAIIISGDRYEGMAQSSIISPIIISLIASLILSRIIIINGLFSIGVALLLTGLTMGLGLIISSIDILRSEGDYGIKGLIVIVVLSNVVILEGFYQLQKVLRFRNNKGN